jgi:DNA-binding NarL/FixJ family response regulator
MIVEDHSLLREGLRSMISGVSDFEVVGEARNGKEAQQVSHNVQPHLILMDLSLPLVSGIEATIQIKRRSPEILILALTVHNSEEYVREALKAGVNGYILKDSSYSDLVFAIRKVLDGKQFLSSEVSGQVVSAYLDGRTANTATTRWAQLTPRERSIVKLVVEGHTNRSAAEHLNISPKTIEKYRSSLMEKLQIRTATELVLLALREGWVEAEHMNTLFRPPNQFETPGSDRLAERANHDRNHNRRSTDISTPIDLKNNPTEN